MEQNSKVFGQNDVSVVVTSLVSWSAPHEGPLPTSELHCSRKGKLAVKWPEILRLIKVETLI